MSLPNSNYTSYYPFVRTSNPQNISVEQYKNLTETGTLQSSRGLRVTTISHCLTNSCTGYYVDTITGSYVFACDDSRHKQKKRQEA